MKVSHKWRVAAVVLVGPTLAIMDSTIVSVILPQLQTAFHTDFQTISWVVSAYFLAQAAVLPIAGYVSDRVSSKVAFMTALALFTTGSLLCSLSPAPEALIAFRVLQGIGGGALLPLSMAINYRNFPPNERSKISAILGIPLVIAPTFGPDHRRLSEHQFELECGLPHQRAPRNHRSAPGFPNPTKTYIQPERTGAKCQKKL